MLIALLGVALVTATGVVIAARQSHSEPTADLSREFDPASRSGSRIDGLPTPSSSTDMSLAPSPTQSPSARLSPTSSPSPTGAGSSPTRSTSPTRTTAPATATTGSPSSQPSINAYITGYSYFDDTPPGSADLANPVLHDQAGGTGTYADPITVAVGHSVTGSEDVLDWPAGTRFYIPNLRRYFIVEDTCGDGSTPQDGPCHTGYPSSATTWLDIWIGGQDGSESGAAQCMDAITGTWAVLVNPASTYATTAGDVYGSAGCATQYGNVAIIG
ncbi:hypothetical protein HDA40_007976 [Hamadaea flava]|uniref:Uncharacterized protein n=1 Tax=Hamadaea flava TaxID=1742688 RepID=A0ABV8LF08_9ACTN|nr:hypothetical protein [Hamadaea flava]MCP2329469.1 hypothetical protein [Hamadaea flava]